MEIFRTVLNNITDETMADWEQCLSGATNKADPNRFENSGLETVLPNIALKSYKNIVIMKLIHKVTVKYQSLVSS
jgi:hypothetical protein